MDLRRRVMERRWWEYLEREARDPPEVHLFTFIVFIDETKGGMGGGHSLFQPRPPGVSAPSPQAADLIWFLMQMKPRVWA